MSRMKGGMVISLGWTIISAGWIQYNLHDRQVGAIRRATYLPTFFFLRSFSKKKQILWIS